MGDTYLAWASVYELFEGEASRATWRDGIVAELERLGCGEARILDLGAGTGIGRKVLGEAFPGARVDSLDRSLAMLEAGGVPPEARILADMAEFRVEEGAYDFVVSGFDALNCLDRYRLGRCLACAAAALRPGGRMVFDYSSRRMLKYDWADVELEREAAGSTLRVRLRHEPVLDRTRVELALSGPGGARWTETHHHYTVDPFLMDELAREAGLSVLRVRDIGRDAFSPSSITHVYVMERSAS